MFLNMLFHCSDIYQEKTSQEIRTLLLQGDPESGLDVDLVWDVMHFVGTPKLLELLRVHELNGWEAIHSELSLPLGQVLVGMDVVAIGFKDKTGKWVCGQS